MRHPTSAMTVPDQAVLALLSVHCLMAPLGHSLAGQDWQQRKQALKVQWGPAGPSGTGGYNFAPPPSYNLPPQSNRGQAGGGYNFAQPPSYGATPSTAGYPGLCSCHNVWLPKCPAKMVFAAAVSLAMQAGARCSRQCRSTAVCAVVQRPATSHLPYAAGHQLHSIYI